MWYVPIRDTTLSDLVRLSPVPVNFVAEVGGILLENCTKYGAYWYEANSTKFKTESHIDILNSLNNNQKIGTLLHEISHAKCSKKNCECVNSDVEGEIHAYTYTLKWLLEYKQKKILKSEMRLVERNAERVDYYGEATKYMINSKLWQKCLNYVNNP